MVPGRGRGRFGAGADHVFHGADLRASGITHVDNIVIGTTVGAAGIVHGVRTGIDGDVGQRTAGVREHDQVTGDKVCVCGIRIRVPGHAAACGIRQIGQAGFPRPDAGGGVGAIVHGGGCHRVVNPCCVNSLDVGKVIAHIIGDEGSAHQSVGFKGRDVGSLTRDRAGICYGFIAVEKRGIIIVTDVRQHIRRIAGDVGGAILGNIQVSVILEVLDIVACILQCPENVVVVHLIRDQGHIRHERDPVGICFQQIVGEIIVHGQAVGKGPVRVIGILCDDRIWSDDEASIFLTIFHRRIGRFRRLRGIRCIPGILRFCFLLRFGGGSCFLRRFGRSGCLLRFCRFRWVRCFGGNRLRCICRLGHCGFAAANVCCRHCLRGKPQDQNDGQQERKQPFAHLFQMQFHPSWKQNEPPPFLRQGQGAIFSCRYYP